MSATDAAAVSADAVHWREVSLVEERAAARFGHDMIHIVRAIMPAQITDMPVELETELASVLPCHRPQRILHANMPSTSSPTDAITLPEALFTVIVQSVVFLLPDLSVQDSVPRAAVPLISVGMTI